MEPPARGDERLGFRNRPTAVIARSGLESAAADMGGRVAPNSTSQSAVDRFDVLTVQTGK